MIRRRAVTSPVRAFLKRLLSRVLGIAALLAISAASATAWAEPDPSGPASAATNGATCAELTARVADLEAYVTNGAPRALVSPGPGHNAWMMTSAALVLCMTLPGMTVAESPTER